MTKGPPSSREGGGPSRVKSDGTRPRETVRIGQCTERQMVPETVYDLLLSHHRPDRQHD
jgi:hypothetical protein